MAFRAIEEKLGTTAQISLRQSLFPVFLVTVLYLLWGFALLDVLNKYMQEVLHVSRVQSSGLQCAYFGSYLIGPLTYSGWLLRRYGYKVTFILGLCIYGVGALAFWPSSVKRSFPGFCGAMFIIGSGLSTIETAANPFIATCGPQKYSGIRLNLAQAIQGAGSVIAPILASQVFFKHEGASNLDSIRFIYLGVACFCFFMAIVYFITPLPEITDTDMANFVAKCTGETAERKSIWQEHMLLLGVFAQFCFIGSQCSIAGFFINVLTEMKPGLRSAQASNYLCMANAIFALGRLCAGIIMKFIKPRYVLLLFLSGTTIFLAASMRATGDAGIAFLCILMFFESTCYPTIFTIALSGLGANTKRGASFLVAGVCGGAIFPPITAAIGDRGRSSKSALCVPLTGLCMALVFPVYCSVYERERLDGVWKVRNNDTRSDEESAHD